MQVDASPAVAGPWARGPCRTPWRNRWGQSSGPLGMAGQTRLGRLAPGRMASWSAWATGSRLQNGAVQRAQAFSPEMPSPPEMRAAATEGPRPPPDPVQPQDQGCKVLAAHESVQWGTGRRRQQTTHEPAAVEGSLQPASSACPPQLRPGRAGQQAVPRGHTGSL